MSNSQYVLVNAYDDMVKTQVWSLMQQMEMCTCEKCFLDACAIVFNNKYTRWVTTLKGGLLTKVPEMNHASQAELTVTIMDALKTVKAHPQH